MSYYYIYTYSVRFYNRVIFQLISAMMSYGNVTLLLHRHCYKLPNIKYSYGRRIK